MKTREEYEKEIYEHLIDNINTKNNPEKYWSHIIVNGMNSQFMFTRNDNLKIDFSKGTYNNRWSISDPVKYEFTNLTYSRAIGDLLDKLLDYLKFKEQERIDIEKLNRLHKFLQLDIKTQRKNKLDKINNNAVNNDEDENEDESR
jgi:hypothetical protein